MLTALSRLSWSIFITPALPQSPCLAQPWLCGRSSAAARPGLAMGSVFPGLSPQQLCSLALTLALPHQLGPAKGPWTPYRSCQAWPWTCLIVTDLPGELDFWVEYWGLPFPAPLLPVLGYPLALGVQGAADPCCSLMWHQPLMVCAQQQENETKGWVTSLLIRESVSQHPCHY